MYDTLIAQELSDGTRNEVGKGNDLRNQNTSETVRWNSASLTPGTIEAPANGTVPGVSAMNNPTNQKTSVLDSSSSKPHNNSNGAPTNADLKTVVVSKNSVNQAQPQIPQQQAQYAKYGVLSRSFSRWSSRITDKSTNRTDGKGSPAKGSGNGGKALPSIQRPLSVNSTLSTTSSSSSSSESSASLRLAPKASPEDEEIEPMPGADLSDEEEGEQTPEPSNNSSYGKDRCFNNSANKGKTSFRKYTNAYIR
jgi:hypothetical protein